MPNIDTIEVQIRTGNEGTDATIYLGLCGREFDLDTADDNFKANGTDIFVLGAGTNLVDGGAFNDPRKPQLITENLFSFPLWIRYGRAPDDDWDLADVQVTVNPGPQQLQFISAVPLPLRLAKEFGEFCFLRSIRT
jgi:hypothetical protein